MCAKCCAFVIFVIYSDICRMIGIPDGHFKIQDDVQVSCRYQFHMNPYIVKCMFTNFGPPVVVNIFSNMPCRCVSACVRAFVRVCARVCV